MDRLGGGAFISYEVTGGKCVRRGCKRDAPFVKIGESVLKQPCEVHEVEQQEAWDREERELRAAQRLAESGLTPRQRTFTLASYEKACSDKAGRDALAVAKRWLSAYLDKDGDAGNLLLWGPIGTGKTGLASGLVRAVCEQGRSARIVNFKALLDEMKGCFDRHQPTTHALGVGSCPLLVLDDLGAERPTEWARDELLGIVDYRYERGLPTIYVSNYSPGDLARRLGRDDLVVGQRIVSRMRERATIFEFVGRDRRESVGSPA